MLKNVQKIWFGIPGSYRTEPNNTEPKLRYSVNSVQSYTGRLKKGDLDAVLHIFGNSSERN